MGVVPKNPESVTSSTVSPMLRTSVALTNDTTMYASKSSVIENQKDAKLTRSLIFVYDFPEGRARPLSKACAQTSADSTWKEKTGVGFVICNKPVLDQYQYTKSREF